MIALAVSGMGTAHLNPIWLISNQSLRNPGDTWLGRDQNESNLKKKQKETEGEYRCNDIRSHGFCIPKG